MNYTMLKRLAALLAAIMLLSVATACTSDAGEGKDTTTEAVTTAQKEDDAGNVWESLLEELEGSETLFWRDENGDIHLPDIPIVPSN